MAKPKKPRKPPSFNISHYNKISVDANFYDCFMLGNDFMTLNNAKQLRAWLTKAIIYVESRERK